MASTKAVLIIGGSGFIGTQLALKLRDEYKVFTTFLTRYQIIPGVTNLPADLNNENWLKRVVYTTNPDVIIYTAGNNDVEWAEKSPREAERIHAGGPADVLTAADILHPKFIYLSNSYTFDGARGNYKEGDTLLPNYVLGKAKVAAENFIRGKSLNYTIVRSSPVYGRGNPKRQTFMDYLRINLDRKKRLEIPNLELQSFAPVSGLVEMIAKLVSSSPKKGVFHYGGLTRVTHYGFAREFAKFFKYDQSLIVPKTGPNGAVLDKYGEPFYWDFSLNSTHAVLDLKIKPFLLEEGFDLIQKQLI